MELRDRTHRCRGMNLYDKVIRKTRVVKTSYYPSKLQHLRQPKLSELKGKYKNQPSSLLFASDLASDEAAERKSTVFRSIWQRLSP